MKKQKIAWWLLVLLIGLALIALLIYIGHFKAGYHIDEIYTYGLSNSSYYPFPNEINRWLNGQFYIDYLTTSSADRFNYDSVIYNQIHDVHPPIYYLIFHTISSYFPGSFSPWIGLSINIVCHLIIYALLIFLAWKLTQQAWLSIMIGVAWAFSIGAIDTSMFIRMYALVTLWQMLLIVASYLYLNQSKAKNCYALAILLIILAGGLTHYYFYIFAGFFIAFSCLYLVFKRRWLDAFRLGLAALSGLGLAFWLFPATEQHLFGTNRGEEALTGLASGEWLANFRTYLGFLKEDLFAGLSLRLVALVLGLGFILLAYRSFHPKEKQVNAFIWLLFLTTGAYFIIVETISYYHTPRYIYGIYPQIILLASLAIVAIVESLISNKKLAQGLSSLLLIGLTLYGAYHGEIGYLYTERANLTELSQARADQPLLVLTSESWMVTKALDQLIYYDDIYPMVSENMEEEKVSEQKEFQAMEQFNLIVVEDDFDNAKVIENIQATYPNHQFTLKYQDASLTYYDARQ